MAVHAADYGVVLRAFVPGHRAFIFAEVEHHVVNVARSVCAHVYNGKRQHRERPARSIEHGILIEVYCLALYEFLHNAARGGGEIRQRRKLGKLYCFLGSRPLFINEHLRKVAEYAVSRFLLESLAAGHDELSVVILEYNAELREHTVRAVAVLHGVHPEEEAVALVGVNVGILVILDLLACRLLRIPCGYDLLAGIFAAVCNAEDESGKLIGGDIQSPAACLDALLIMLPEGPAGDAERLKQAGSEVVYNSHAGELLDYNAAHIGVFAYVAPALARGKGPLGGEEILDPCALGLVAEQADILARRHGEQVIYRQLLEVIVVLLGSVFGEKVDHLCVEREQTLVNGEAYRH